MRTIIRKSAIVLGLDQETLNNPTYQALSRIKVIKHRHQEIRREQRGILPDRAPRTFKVAA